MKMINFHSRVLHVRCMCVYLSAKTDIASMCVYLSVKTGIMWACPLPISTKILTLLHVEKAIMRLFTAFS